MAKLLDLPVILVVDCSSMARSAAAIVHGFRTFDPDLRVVGVILNKVASAVARGDGLREAHRRRRCPSWGWCRAAATCT